MSYNTREAWLQAAIEQLRPHFQPHAALPAKLHALISFPFRSSKAQGQWFPAGMLADKLPLVLVTPDVKDPVKVLDILVHELIHVATPGARHGKEFKELATKVGHTGRMPSSHGTPELLKKLGQLLSALGPYPHAVFHADNQTKPKGEKTSVKYVSPEVEGYSCWVSKKQAAEIGAPICPVSKRRMIEEA